MNDGGGKRADRAGRGTKVSDRGSGAPAVRGWERQDAARHRHPASVNSADRRSGSETARSLCERQLHGPMYSGYFVTRNNCVSSPSTNLTMRWMCGRLSGTYSCSGKDNRNCADVGHGPGAAMTMFVEAKIEGGARRRVMVLSNETSCTWCPRHKLRRASQTRRTASLGVPAVDRRPRSRGDGWSAQHSRRTGLDALRPGKWPCEDDQSTFQRSLRRLGASPRPRR